MEVSIYFFSNLDKKDGLRNIKKKVKTNEGLNEVMAFTANG